MRIQHKWYRWNLFRRPITFAIIASKKTTLTSIEIPRIGTLKRANLTPTYTYTSSAIDLSAV